MKKARLHLSTCVFLAALLTEPEELTMCALVYHLVGCWLQRHGLPVLTVWGEAGGWSIKPPSKCTMSQAHVTIRPIKLGSTASTESLKSRDLLQDPDSVRPWPTSKMLLRLKHPVGAPTMTVHVGHSHCSANRLHRKQAVTRSHLAHSPWNEQLSKSLGISTAHAFSGKNSNGTCQEQATGAPETRGELQPVLWAGTHYHPQLSFIYLFWVLHRSLIGVSHTLIAWCSCSFIQ